MKINYIKYHNYRCFEDVSVRFDTDAKKNISLVMGVIGSGKTEMLFSFQWVLYGFDFKRMREKEETPYSLNSALYHRLQTNSNANSVDCWVELSFSHQEREYIMKRTETFFCNKEKVDSKVKVSLSYTERNGEHTLPITDKQKVEDTLGGTEKYTNHAYILDYSIAVISGIINGIIDSVFIGEWNFETAKAKSNQYVNEKVMEFAKKKGFKGNRFDQAVKFLEDRYPLPGDDSYKSVVDEFGKQEITMKTHHLDDLSHHPTLIGLIASIIVQFSGEARYMPKSGGIVKISVDVNEYGN